MKLIILDRDGVINQDSPNFVKNASEWIPIEGSLEAIARLNAAGYKVVIASNQSGLNRQLFSIDDLNAIHNKMHQLLKEINGDIDAIFICPHLPDEGCQCRKPLPGMFNEIIRRYDIDKPERIYAVGDSLRDLQAAQAAGFKPWLVLTGNGSKTQASPDFNPDTPVSPDLASVVASLLDKHD